MATPNVYDFESSRKDITRAPLSFPSKTCRNSTNPAESLHPLAAAKYYDTPAKQLLFDFIQDFLQVKIIGFQSGYGTISDQILFNDPVYRTTIAIPCGVMLEPMERAREIVQQTNPRKAQCV